MYSFYALAVMLVVCHAQPKCEEAKRVEAAVEDVGAHVFELTTLHGRELELRYVLDQLAPLSAGNHALRKTVVALLDRLVDVQNEMHTVNAHIEAMNLRFSH